MRASKARQVAKGRLFAGVRTDPGAHTPAQDPSQRGKELELRGEGLSWATVLRQNYEESHNSKCKSGPTGPQENIFVNVDGTLSLYVTAYELN